MAVHRRFKFGLSWFWNGFPNVHRKEHPFDGNESFRNFDIELDDPITPSFRTTNHWFVEQTGFKVRVSKPK